MARSRISEWGDEVLLRMTFAEAAALRALLARVDATTNEEVATETQPVFYALDDVKTKVQERGAGLWPLGFERFASGTGGLLDPENPPVKFYQDPT